MVFWQSSKIQLKRLLLILELADTERARYAAFLREKRVKSGADVETTEGSAEIIKELERIVYGRFE